MVATIPGIERPELFFGFVSPIGADVEGCVQDFETHLSRLGYRVATIKVTDVFRPLSAFVKPRSKLVSSPQHKRYSSHISYGNQLRKRFSDDAFLAAMTIGRIARKRPRMGPAENGERFSKTAYLLYQFKREEEIDLLRSVYDRLFFQISVYSRRGARVDFLSRLFASSENSANINTYRALADDMIQRDENEQAEIHGQRVSRIFHDADFIVNLDIEEPSREDQVRRFCELLFGSNSISPTKDEYGLFVDKAAALRTLDLSRQVGAAIFSSSGEIISMGSNEVPKGEGGTYWSDEEYDDRDYVRKIDSNDKRKIEILREIIGVLGVDLDSALKMKAVRDSQFMDALEYGRIIHAEMSALSDTARLGCAVKDGILYCTTFPCHMCAKHIVAAGIEKVVFLEPYPKSLVLDLHSDSVIVEGNDRGRFAPYPAVKFEHFYGISPRRYRQLFERLDKRKEGAVFKEWSLGEPRPDLAVKSPFYRDIERAIVNTFIASYMLNASLGPDVLTV